MSDKRTAPRPIPPTKDVAPSSSEPSAISDGPGGPPPAPEAAGAAPPADSSGDAQPGADVPILESQPIDITTVETSQVIETPTQGAAVVAGEPIPSVDSVAENAAEAAAEQSSPVLTPEHPYETLQRLRTKLGAYGAECVKTVQPEIEYLQSLCAPDPRL